MKKSFNYSIAGKKDSQAGRPKNGPPSRRVENAPHVHSPGNWTDPRPLSRRSLSLPGVRSQPRKDRFSRRSVWSVPALRFFFLAW